MHIQYVDTFVQNYNGMDRFIWLDITFSTLVGFIYLFGVLHRFQHCTGHITTGSWKGRGNQYIQFVMVLYCKLPMASNYQLSHLRPCWGSNPGLRGGRRECYHSATVAPARWLDITFSTLYVSNSQQLLLI